MIFRMMATTTRLRRTDCILFRHWIAQCINNSVTTIAAAAAMNEDDDDDRQWQNSMSFNGYIEYSERRQERERYTSCSQFRICVHTIGYCDDENVAYLLFSNVLSFHWSILFRMVPLPSQMLNAHLYSYQTTNYYQIRNKKILSTSLPSFLIEYNFTPYTGECHSDDT